MLTHLNAAIAATVLLLVPLLASECAAASGQGGARHVELDRLALEVERLEGARAIKNLQRAYGYYTDMALWNEVAGLFAADAALELGADGVYVGRNRIREYLTKLGGGQTGLQWGQLAEHLQLQPVIHVAADGRTATGRWRDLAMLGRFKESAAWGEGIYENTYVKRDGVWLIQSLHLYTNYVAPFESGWARLKSQSDWRSATAKTFPPDRPSTRTYKTFPEAFVPPFHYGNPGKAAAMTEANVSDPRIQALKLQARRLRDRDEIENLQGIYGYYFDKNLWDDVAALFAENATFEDGQRGVYVGRGHIRKALQLFGPNGPQRGRLNNYLQLQPVIHVADDGRTAKGRWQGILQLAEPNTAGAWGVGVYENEYVRERGGWRISKLHFYLTAQADYDLMWAKGPIPAPTPSAVLPPDRPPTEVYRSFPGVYMPPFHYVHPVTGQPIGVDPQPADSVIRPQKH
jgi:hypothetical protein